MLSRLVRIQLAIFTIASIIGVCVMAFYYMQAPTMLGVGRVNVKLELPASGGLYRFSNVTYRGVQIGKVTALRATADGAEATLSLDASPAIPADLRAEVRSISAVGEQYVDLYPRTDSPPYLHDGSVIAARDTTIPQEVGPMLDQVSALVDSIPEGKLSGLLDESYKGFNGAGYDLGSLFDSASQISGDFNAAADQTRTLMEDTGPLLDSQADTADAIRQWSRSLAGFTEQVAINDRQVRTLLQAGPGAFNEVSRLMDQVKPTLPILLANLTSIGQVGLTYHDSIRQLLVLLPPYVASLQAGGPNNNATGMALGEFGMSIGDPPACTTGFLPPSQWRSPADLSDIDTPDGLYCKLPQDSPIAVRGARNYPCIGVPGKRAPTVQMCNSDKPFEPLAQRQHMFGPYPIDPNLIGQGIPPDSRVNPGANIYGPLEGTPLPPGGTPLPPDGGTAPAPPGAPPPVPAEVPFPVPMDVLPPAGQDGGPPAAAPSSFTTQGSGPVPSVAAATYNPSTGQYATPDGEVFRQADLVASGAPKSWKELVLQ
ncbi:MULTISPECIES: MlaD family protein [unclassified Mycobacterium]|uniref:MlaD family protein n=1 Tax=unclassified Mycobacterium TaxID=2642494 RepID=UPI0029C8BABF|nr:MULTISPECIES: MlaD family protein [unclassified Mycobacterium]